MSYNNCNNFFNVYYNKVFYYTLSSINSNVIIHRTDLRSFTGFNSYDDLIDWYMGLKSDERYFDEVIIGPRKIILDIDSKDDLDNNVWNYMLECYISQLRSLLYKPSIMIYTSNGENIKSAHIIVTNYYTINGIHSYSIAYEISRSIPSEFTKYIDLGIYKETQFMRIEGSRKPCTNRFLYLDGINYIYDLRYSLLGYIHGCHQYIPSTIYKRSTKNIISDKF